MIVVGSGDEPPHNPAPHTPPRTTAMIVQIAAIISNVTSILHFPEVAPGGSPSAFIARIDDDRVFACNPAYLGYENTEINPAIYLFSFPYDLIPHRSSTMYSVQY